MENSEQDNTDNGELEMGSDSDTEEECDTEEEDNDEVGFGPHESDSDTSSVDIDYFETPLAYLSGRPMYFNDWVGKMISRAEDDARWNVCGRPVDKGRVCIIIDGHRVALD
ncbi:hypothetical protein CIB48_g11379 [Xylaria polymorpha]|nr:hypothetical protein CIB48_g11379 [Xylaria polymorpha]